MGLQKNEYKSVKNTIKISLVKWLSLNVIEFQLYKGFIGALCQCKIFKKKESRYVIQLTIKNTFNSKQGNSFEKNKRQTITKRFVRFGL